MKKRQLTHSETHARFVAKPQMPPLQQQDSPGKEAALASDSILDVLPVIEPPLLQLVRLDENETLVIPFTMSKKMLTCTTA